MKHRAGLVGSLSHEVSGKVQEVPSSHRVPEVSTGVWV